MKRRDFLKILSQSAAGVALAPSVAQALCPPNRLQVNGGGTVVAPAGNCTPTLPPTALDLQTYRTAGYLVATDFTGVVANGVADCTVGLNVAVKASRDQRKPLYFPSGTYLVTDTLFVLKWDSYTAVEGSNHQLFGCSINRPIIKLKASLTKFASASAPQPVVMFYTFSALSADVPIPGPYPSPSHSVPTGYRARIGNGFHEAFQNFIIDTSGNPGAIGVTFGTCQNSYMNNIKVIATGSYAGFNGAGGTQGSADLEVDGGQYGITYEKFNGCDVGSGSAVVGARLYNQTRACVHVGDYCPTVYVGFHFKRSTSGMIVEIPEKNWATSQSTPVFIDGIIESAGGTAFSNFDNTCYIRNVYIRGTDSLIKTGALATITATGTWKRIVEYSASNSRWLPYQQDVAGQTKFKHNTVINGVVTFNQQWPNFSIQSGVSAPSEDFVAKHTITAKIPYIDNGPYIDVTKAPYNVVPYVPSSYASDLAKAAYLSPPIPQPTDCLAKLHQAFADAEAAGHNRVFLPRGIYFISGTLNLRNNTQLFGAGVRMTNICSSPTWVPTSGSPFMVSTPNDTSGRASMSNIAVLTNSQLGTKDSTTGVYSGDRFSFIQWRVGRRSWTFGVETRRRYYDESIPTNAKTYYEFSGGGGGRHYWCEEDGRGNSHSGVRVIKAVNTTEPLSFYGPSMEISKGSGLAGTNPALYCSEFVDCRNVRIYAAKREGNASTACFTSCQNVALYGAGVQMTTPQAGYLVINGTSDGILIAVSTVQEVAAARTATVNMLSESITGKAAVNIPWPEGISLYKRDHAGVFNDALMVHI